MPFYDPFKIWQGFSLFFPLPAGSKNNFIKGGEAGAGELGNSKTYAMQCKNNCSCFKDLM